MTPKRKMYYRSISKEEQAIRGLLYFERRELKQSKRLAFVYAQNTEDENSRILLIGCLHSIKAIKFQIKAIKRQLPAPLKHYLDSSICRCGMHYKHAEVAGMFWCKHCGQAISPTSWYCAEGR